MRSGQFSIGRTRVGAIFEEADKGLIAFRRGKLVEGIAKYQGAIDNFQKAGFAPLALSAKTYLFARWFVQGCLKERRCWRCCPTSEKFER